MFKIAALVSGSGTLREAASAAGIDFAIVLADRPCRALEVAKAEGLRIKLVSRPLRRSEFTPEKRDDFSAEVAQCLEDEGIRVTASMGFNTRLSPVFFTIYGGVATNSHPALLPKYKGEEAVADTLRARESIAGSTIHYLTEDLDGGPVIAQVEVPVLPEELDESISLALRVAHLWERIKVEERKLYPEVIREQLTKIAPGVV
jgi:phosphoribosylglycinamide formyltransferase-1